MNPAVSFFLIWSVIFSLIAGAFIVAGEQKKKKARDQAGVASPYRPFYHRLSFRIGGWIGAALPWLVFFYGMYTLPPGSSAANMASNGTPLNQFVMAVAIIPCVGCPGIAFVSFLTYWLFGPLGLMTAAWFARRQQALTNA